MTLLFCLLAVCFVQFVLPSDLGLSQRVEIPTERLVRQRRTAGHQDKPYTLECEYSETSDTNLLPAVLWGNTNSELLRNGAGFKNYGESLKIKSVDFGDEGNYICRASNTDGKTAYLFNIAVKSALVRLDSSPDPQFGHDQNVVFLRNTAAKSDHRIELLVDYFPIKVYPLTISLKVEDNVLHFKKYEDIGPAMYRCKTSNAHEPFFKNIFLNVPAPPVIKVAKGSKVTIPCQISSSYPESRFIWREEWQNRSDTESRFEVLENGNLEITNVQFSDQGNYSCFDDNNPESIEADITLEVKDKTVITRIPEDIKTASYRTVSLECQAVADPSLDLSLTWLHNGQPIDFDKNPRLLKTVSNTLTITNVKRKDSGIYRCIAKTEVDQDMKEATLTVKDIPEAPEWISVSCKDHHATLRWKPAGDGGELIIFYEIFYNTSSNPSSWTRSNGPIPAIDTEHAVPLAQGNSFSFIITAYNNIGPSLPSVVSETCRTSDDVPRKHPENVEAKGTKEHSFVISWEPVRPIDQGGQGFCYKVSWKPQDATETGFQEAIISDWTQTELIFDNVGTFKAYVIKVEALNTKGAANTAAREVTGYSREGPPSEGPTDLKLMATPEPWSAIISWIPVAEESINGHFRGYKIQTWTEKEGQKWMREEVVQSSVNTTLISILQPNSRNFIRVLAFNGMFDGPPSETIEINTTESVPGPVNYFSSIPMGSSSLYLLWEKPLQPNGVLTGYKIFYTEVFSTHLEEEKELHPAITDPEVTRTKLTGLKPNTRYRLIIRATTSVGQGLQYFFEQETSPENRNHPPEEPSFAWSRLPVVENKASVCVSWYPSRTGPYPGEDFFVQYRKTGELTWNSTPTERLHLTTNIQDLVPNTRYQMRVVAVDEHFQTPSQVKDVNTGPDMPKIECNSSDAKLDLEPSEHFNSSTLRFSMQINHPNNQGIGSLSRTSHHTVSCNVSDYFGANYYFQITTSGKSDQERLSDCTKAGKGSNNLHEITSDNDI